MIYLLLFLLGLSIIGIAYSLSRSQQDKRLDYLNEFTKLTDSKAVSSKQQAINMKSLSGYSFWDRVGVKWKNLQEQLGSAALVKVVVFFCVLFVVARLVNYYYLPVSPLGTFVVISIAGTLYMYQWLQDRDRRKFEESFSVALNMLTSAVSSGESVGQAINYVGETLEGKVATEFRAMGQRLQMGESIDDVFRRACIRLPYPTFYFFVITLRANMERGGQLKDIIQRLNRMMFNIRSLEKKKFAMTSEARASVKIVAVIPFIMLLALRFISPDNYQYILFDSTGQYILYYMLTSEFIGISIVWGLMRSVR